jgi:hypothetical protein
MFYGILPISEQTGALGDDVHAEFLPSQHCRVFDRCDRYGFSVDFYGVVFGDDRPIEYAVHGVVFQQVSHSGRVGEIVHGDHLDIGMF